MGDFVNRLSSVDKENTGSFVKAHTSFGCVFKYLIHLHYLFLRIKA